MSAQTIEERLVQLNEAVRTARASAKQPAAVSEKGLINQTAVSMRVFENLLKTEGLRTALYSLLRLTDYRFISIFRFMGGMATSVVHVDRENLGILQASEVPDTATYCCYVRDADGAFVTSDAMNDPRTQAHPAREAVRSYCGVPIVAPDGTLIGTLCHYDLLPKDPEQLDLTLLVEAASAIAHSGLVPAYPDRT